MLKTVQQYLFLTTNFFFLVLLAGKSVEIVYKRTLVIYLPYWVLPGLNKIADSAPRVHHLRCATLWRDFRCHVKD